MNYNEETKQLDEYVYQLQQVLSNIRLWVPYICLNFFNVLQSMYIHQVPTSHCLSITENSGLLNSATLQYYCASIATY